MQPSARVLADSVSFPDLLGRATRLTTLEVTMHRFVLAELNTHRAFSRNSASSRAIPARRQLDAYRDDFAFPLSWPAEKAGMSGGAELEGWAKDDARDLLHNIRGATEELLFKYLESHPDASTRLHKSVLNRYIEPGMWHTVIVTATDWENFFELRLAPSAQPEIRAAAEQMKAAIDASEPRPIAFGEWHLPLVTEADDYLNDTAKIKVSAARCAAVSYNRQNDTDIQKELARFDLLASNKHMSPFEHVATPAPGGRYGNFDGWKQARWFMERGFEFPV